MNDYPPLDPLTRAKVGGNVALGSRVFFPTSAIILILIRIPEKSSFPRWLRGVKYLRETDAHALRMLTPFKIKVTDMPVD